MGICDACIGKKGQKNPDGSPIANPNAPRLSRDEQKQFNSISPKIVILGAGAAGLAAAQRLSDSSFNNIMILEAQNYIGGRINSVPIDDGFIEKGAEFLHGENNLSAMVQQNSWPGSVFDTQPSIHVAAKEHSDFAGVFVVDNPDALKDYAQGPLEDIRKDVQKKMNEIIEKSKDIVAQMPPTTTPSQTLGEPRTESRKASAVDPRQFSLGHYMRTEFERYMATHDDDAPPLKAYRWAVYDWITRVHLSDNSCRSLYEISLPEYAKFAGSLECVPLKVPMVDALKLVAPFATGDKAPVMLSKPVKQLRFDPTSPSPVVISCDDGQLFVADHCIVTASLGYLKRNHETFFVPPLPADKIKAIGEAGFGTVNKVFLTFAEPFWKNISGDSGGIQLLYLNDPRGSQQKPWHRSIIGFDVCTTLANTLSAWIGGSDQSEAVEKLSEAEIGADCQALLQGFLKNVIVPPPIRVIRTTWANNPYILGTYSNAAVNQGENINLLAQPTWFYRKATNSSSVGTSTADPDLTAARKSMDGYQLPGLLFAGEATHATWFATVPGALESGKREADRLIELYKPLIEQMQRRSIAMQDKRTSVQTEERLSLSGPASAGATGVTGASFSTQGQSGSNATGATGERKSLDQSRASSMDRGSLSQQRGSSMERSSGQPPSRSPSNGQPPSRSPSQEPAKTVSGNRA